MLSIMVAVVTFMGGTVVTTSIMVALFLVLWLCSS